MERLHAPLLAELRDQLGVEVTGCFDLDPRRAKHVGALVGAPERGRPRPVSSAEPVDGAIIATPPEGHAEVAATYLAAGKHVLLEKPMAARGEDAERLAAMAREAGCCLVVGHFWRFFPSLDAARRLIRRGLLGTIRSVEASEGFRWSWFPRSTYVVSNPFGGVIHDSGSHLLDAVLFLLSLDGGPELAFDLREVAKTPGSEPSHHCRARIELDGESHSRIEVRLVVSRVEPVARAIKVRGDRGTLVVPTAFARGPILWIEGRSFAVADLGEVSGRRSVWDCLAALHRTFVARCRGEDAPGLVDGERFVGLTRLLEGLWAAEPQEALR